VDGTVRGSGDPPPIDRARARPERLGENFPCSRPGFDSLARARDSAAVKFLPRAPLLALLLALPAGLACGPSPAQGAAPGRLPRPLDEGFPLRLASAEGVQRLATPPRHLLPVNAAWVDFVSLLVGPERLAGLPAEAFGYSRLDPGDPGWSALPRLQGFESERILALRPDLVLAHSWQSPQTLAAVRAAGVPTLIVPVPASWEEIEATLELLARVLDVPEQGRECLRSLRARREALRLRARPFAGLRALCYTNLGAGGWTAGTGTTAQVLLELAGLQNAAALAGLQGDVSAEQERLLALAPDLFVVGWPDRSESSPPSADFLLQEPALAGLPAIRERRVLALPPALFTTASPELLSGAERLIQELEGLSADAAPGSRPAGE